MAAPGEDIVLSWTIRQEMCHALDSQVCVHLPRALIPSPEMHERRSAKMTGTRGPGVRPSLP